MAIKKIDNSYAQRVARNIVKPLPKPDKFAINTERVANIASKIFTALAVVLAFAAALLAIAATNGAIVVAGTVLIGTLAAAKLLPVIGISCGAATLLSLASNHTASKIQKTNQKAAAQNAPAA